MHGLLWSVLLMQQPFDHIIWVIWYDPYRVKISKFVIDFNLRRNQPFYSLTLFIPILVLTLLSPIGLLLPGKLYTLTTNRLTQKYFSWCWRKDGTPNNSFAFWYHLCWYSPIYSTSFWFIWKCSSYTKFFYCFNIDVDSLLARNGLYISIILYEMQHIICCI